jgi:hypothetical protein
MPHFFRTQSFSFAVVCWLLFTTFSCKKKEDNVVPEDLTGALDATFSPAGSLSLVSLSQQGNSTTVTSAQPDATGYMKISNLAAGNYVLIFSPASGYRAPAPQNITIAAKTNTALGTIQVDKQDTNVSYALKGNVSWTSNLIPTLNSAGGTTTAVNAPSAGSVIFYNGVLSLLTIKATYQSGTTAETVTLTTRYAGAGQYNLGNFTGGGTGTYLQTIGGAAVNSFDTGSSGVQGTLTVTAHDLAKRTLSGTFGFNGYSYLGVRGLTVTNGTFSLSY